MPTSPDDDLLARLNALKQSNISLDTNRTVPAPPSAGVSEPFGKDVPESDPILDLAARFRKLGGSKSSSPARQPARVPVGVGEGGSDDIEIEATFRGHGPTTDVDDDHDKTLEELLAELGTGHEWNIGKEEERCVGALVNDIRVALPNVIAGRETPPQQQGQGNNTSKTVLSSSSAEAAVAAADSLGNAQQHEGNGMEDNDDEELQDEQEADEYIAKVLAELDFEEKHGKQADPARTEEAPPDSVPPTSKETGADTGNADLEDSLNLPSAPTALPQSPPSSSDFEAATVAEDSLAARLNALSLPSAPSFAPSTKPVKVTKGQGKSNLPTFSDEDIDSWCIICNDDATVKCLGCDGDLYCRKCWKEGHIGENVGFEEKTHKWIKYEPKKRAP